MNKRGTEHACGLQGRNWVDRNCG